MTLAEIRPATLDETGALASLKVETFRESFVTGGFAIPYPPADLAAFEAAAYAPHVVRAEIQDPRKVNWIAWQDGKMLGYVHVGPCKLPHPDATSDAGEIYQLYVRDGAQGLGLGRQLLAVAMNHLAGAFPGPIWLGVWSGNIRAQAIYEKLGFEHVGHYEFPVGAWRDQEYIFRRNQGA